MEDVMQTEVRIQNSENRSGSVPYFKPDEDGAFEMPPEDLLFWVNIEIALAHREKGFERAFFLNEIRKFILLAREIDPCSFPGSSKEMLNGIQEQFQSFKKAIEEYKQEHSELRNQNAALIEKLRALGVEVLP